MFSLIWVTWVLIFGYLSNEPPTEALSIWGFTIRFNKLQFPSHSLSLFLFPISLLYFPFQPLSYFTFLYSFLTKNVTAIKSRLRITPTTFWILVRPWIIHLSFKLLVQWMIICMIAYSVLNWSAKSLTVPVEIAAM